MSTLPSVMRATEVPPSTNIAVVPQWDPKHKRQVTKILFLLVTFIVLVAWVVTLYWLFGIAAIQEAVPTPSLAGTSLTVLLAPVLAAAAGVERLLETIFGIIEQYWRTLVAYLGRGLRWLHSAESELQEARKWLADVSREADKILTEIPITPQQLQAIVPDKIDRGRSIDEWRAEVVARVQQQMELASSMMALAEKRLADAEHQLASACDSPDYKNAKRAACIVLGLWMGVVIATVGQLQAFAMLGIDVVPARIDVLITGLVIGSGSYPVHSLVGVMQQAKDTLEGAQSYLKSKSSQVRQLVER